MLMRQLSHDGHRQAVELATYMKSLPADEQPQLVVSSPFLRCVQTAHPAAVVLDLPLCLDHGLCEWFTTPLAGTGEHPRPYPVIDLSRLLPEYKFDLDYAPTCYSSTRGESIEELHRRTNTFLDLFLSRLVLQYPKVKRVLLVTHAALVISLGQAASRCTWSQLTRSC